jgi:hypothetical protein
MEEYAELISAPWKAVSLVTSLTHISEEAIVAGAVSMTKPLIEATASSTSSTSQRPAARPAARNV